MEKKIATIIIKEVKSRIMEMKKKRPNMPVYSLPLSMQNLGNSTTDNICIAPYNCYQYAKLAEKLTRSQARRVSEELVKCLNELKATRGWSGLMWEFDDCCYDSRSWHDNSVKFPTDIILMGKPCKEYNSLANYLAKYCNKKLNETDVYSVHIGGKRGRVYGEYGTKYYLCHNSELCENILADLRKYRGSNDKVVCSNIKEHDDIDEWELLVSIRNEVEFEGVRNKYFEVKISTPSGKEKKTITIGRK